MPTWVIVLIVAAAVIVLTALVIGRTLAAGHRRAELQERFGPEYGRLVDAGSRRSAEHELQERERQHSSLQLSALSEADRRHFADRWQEVQLSFVDEPAIAVGTAADLVRQVMTERGYPSQADLSAQADQLSVEHARQLDNLRSAQQISAAAAAGRATTEDLRQAMVRYRALFADLLRASSRELTAYPEEPEQRVRVIRR